MRNGGNAHDAGSGRSARHEERRTGQMKALSGIWQRRRHKRSGPLLAIVMLASGGLANLVFAPFFLLFLLPLCWGGLYFVARQRQPAAAAAAGFWFGLGHFAFGLSWIAEAYRMRADIPDWLGPPSVLALALYLACYPALATGLFAAWRRYRPAGGMVDILVFAGLWALAEYLRGTLLTGFPWNPLAASLAFSALSLQPIALIGPHAMGLLLVLWAILPVEALMPTSPAGRGKRAWLWLAVVALPVAVAAFGWWRLPSRQAPTLPDVTLRLVQPNTDQRHKWDPDRRGRHLAQLVDLSRSLGRPETERLIIIWPEAAIPEYRFADQPGRRALIMRMLPPHSILIAGSPRVAAAANGTIRLFNSLLVLGEHGEILARYDKRHLVPFGEYLPARPLLAAIGLEKLTEGTLDFSPGTTPAVLTVPGLPPFAAFICYEAIFPESAREARREGGAFLLNLTNDAWFGLGAGPHQHFAMARMRSVETGLPLVRVAQTGISAVIDGWGRVRVRIPLGQRSARDAALPGPAASPLYARLGEGIFWGLLILIFLLAIMAGVRYSKSE